ncbi:Ba155 [Baboon cytomegalovirus]|nr:Ba155 [Baboon cytomegalovirus]
MLRGLNVVCWLTTVVVTIADEMNTPEMCADVEGVKVKCMIPKLDNHLYWFMNLTHRIWAFNHTTSYPYELAVRQPLWSPYFEMLITPVLPHTTVGILLEETPGRPNLLCAGVVPHREQLRQCEPEFDARLLCSISVLLSVLVIVAGILKTDHDTTGQLYNYKLWLSRRTRYFEPAVKRW